MALDIAKSGKKSYQKFEQPEAPNASGVHVRRYVGAFFGRALSVALLLSAFLVPASVWNIGLAAPFGRQVAWVALSGLLSALLVWHGLFRHDVARHINSVAVQYRAVAMLALALLAVFAVGSFAHLGISGSLGFGASTTQLSFLGAVFGVAWCAAVVYGKGNREAVKQLLASVFLGSTVFAGYLVAVLLFGGGYAAVSWIGAAGVPFFFVLVVFLMIAFTLFQQRVAKLLWTASILLHLAVLFAWDMRASWLTLIAGISMLLVFQIVYSEKLWQRNFIYPLQIWTIAVVLLVVPIKLFTGTSVPTDMVLGYGASRQAVSSIGVTLFGAGLSASDEQARRARVSFEDMSTVSRAAAPAPVIENGYIQLYLAAGIAGLMAWLLFFGFVLLRGFGFWRKNMKMFKEGAMSEDGYLGAVVAAGLCLFFVGLAFSPLSVLVYWLGMLLIGCGLVLWYAEDAPPQPARSVVSVRQDRFRYAVAAVVSFMCLVLLVAVARGVIAGRLAAASSSEIDPAVAAAGFARAARLAPWNPWHNLGEARAFLNVLGTAIPVDAQRNAIERVTSILRSESKKSNNPAIHWVAASMYADLESYAEGSAALARLEYRTAQALAPNNAQLPVSVAAFYRDHAGALVSGDVSADELRQEARDGLLRALSIAPDYLPARLELAFVLEDEEGVAQAILELAPWERTSPEIMYHIGRLYFNEGEFEKAAEKFLAVIADVPTHSNARYSLGVAYFRLEKYPQALAQFQEVLNLNPGNTDVQAKIDQVKKLVGE